MVDCNSCRYMIKIDNKTANCKKFAGQFDPREYQPECDKYWEIGKQRIKRPKPTNFKQLMKHLEGRNI